MKEKKLTINHLPIDDIRKLFISYVDEYHNGNQTHCAQHLDISPNCVNKFHSGRSDEINKKIIEEINGYLTGLVDFGLVDQIKRNTLVYYTLE